MKTVEKLFNEVLFQYLHHVDVGDIRDTKNVKTFFMMHPERILDTVLFLCEELDQLNEKIEQSMETSNYYVPYNNGRI